MTALTQTFHSIRRADQHMLHRAAGLRHPKLDLIMRALTRAGDWESWTILILAALARGTPYRGIALRVLPKLLLTLGIGYVIKRFSRRKRPSECLADFKCLLENPDPYSFPSSHAACSWAVAVSLGMIVGAWPIWIAYATAISYSRIHIGAHYPLDVIMGTALGTTVALVA